MRDVEIGRFQLGSTQSLRFGITDEPKIESF